MTGKFSQIIQRFFEPAHEVARCGPSGQLKPLLIVSESLSRYSETFIRRHINELPFEITVLHGIGLSELSNGGHLISKYRLIRFLAGRMASFGWLDLNAIRDHSLANYLSTSGTRAVLAEYGVCGTAVVNACQLARVPLVVHFHGFDAYKRSVLEQYAEAYERLFKIAEAIVGVSRDMCDQLENIGAPKEKIFYIPYKVDVEKFAMASHAQMPPVFLAVGRFVPKKAPDLVIRAFAKILASSPESRLEMIGDGPLLAQCIQLAESLGMRHAVTFHGVKSHQFVAKRMRCARCFVQHSVRAPDGDSEGTPLAILEAQCCGLPVVSTRHAGIKDVVVERQTGFLVDEGDVDKMAEYMLLLARDWQLAGKLGAAATEGIKSRFGHDQTLGKLSELVTQAMVAR